MIHEVINWEESSNQSLINNLAQLQVFDLHSLELEP